MIILSIISILYVILSKKKIPNRQSFKLLLLIFIIISFAHCFLKDDYNIPKLVSSVINIIGYFAIAIICKKSFVRIYLQYIYITCIVSLVIYFLCFVPSIKDTLFQFALKFPSLNNEIAVSEGGGVNFIIYNFQSLWIDELIGISRNCGPFWEPGMFAVYIVLGLTLYNFFYRQKIFAFNIVLIISLVTTISTGGYIVGIVLLFFCILRKENSYKNLLYLPIFICIVVCVINLDYIGEKTFKQLNNITVGSDASRFGAMVTQINMIANSPIIGGESVSNYTSGKTLASGLLLPIVGLGIPAGILFYLLMLNSYVKLSCYFNGDKKSGIILLIIILTLSISQTILATPFFVSLMFYCLMLPCVNINMNYENSDYFKQRNISVQ